MANNGENTISELDAKSKSRKELRIQGREARHRQGTKEALSSTVIVGSQNTRHTVSTDLVDDHASAWQECQEEGKLWGGRGHGGRGVRFTGENYDNVHLPSVSLQFEGNELLVDSIMNIIRGHRYGLLGRNGVGKS